MHCTLLYTALCTVLYCIQHYALYSTVYSTMYYTLLYTAICTGLYCIQHYVLYSMVYSTMYCTLLYIALYTVHYSSVYTTLQSTFTVRCTFTVHFTFCTCIVQSCGGYLTKLWPSASGQESDSWRPLALCHPPTFIITICVTLYTVAYIEQCSAVWCIQI